MDILTISAVNLLLGLCLFFIPFFHSKNRPTLKHFLFFSLAGLCLTLNSTLAIVHNIVTLPIYLLPALANTATVGLHCAVLVGLLKLYQQQFRASFLWLPVLLAYGLCFVEPFKTQIAMRLVANFALIMALNALSLRVLCADRRTSVAVTLFKLILSFNLLQLLIRATLYVLDELGISQLAQHLIVHQIGWFAFTMYCSGILAGCLLLLVEQRHQELEQKANTDPLTGLLNRNELISSLNRELTLCIAQQQAMTIMILDIDHFKKINDSYGHATGDLAIQHVAAAMRRHFRNYDLLYRIGGEEFLVCLPNLDAEQARNKFEQLRLEFLNQPLEAQQAIKITVSMGWISTRQPIEVETLVKYADDALYQAKDLGRNKVQQALF